VTAGAAAPPAPVVLDGAFAQDPYAVFDRLRPQGQVHRVRTALGEPVWLVVGHAEARQALLDRSLVTTPAAAAPPVPVDCPHPLVLEGPDHARLRGLLSPRLSRGAAMLMRPRIQQIADDLVSGLLRAGERPVDLLAEYAQPLPTLVLYEVLGLPADGMSVVGRLLRRATAPDLPPAELARTWRTYTDHVGQVIAAKRSSPGDDLVTDLLRACAAGQLSEVELLGTVRLLLQVGDETIWHVVGNGVLALIEQPDAWEELQQHPERVGAAVEELLRHDAPVNAAVTRYAASDTEIAGVVVRAGEAVLVSLTAGGRDPRRHGCPASVDLERDNAQGIGFGLGSHYCVGAALARVECEVALRTLLARCRVRLAGPRQALRRRDVPLLHGWESLPVVLTAR
jgi:cytochrome P450